MVATPTTSLGFQNFFSATLSADITASSTDIFLDNVPTVSEGFLVIDPDNASAREVIYYNSKTALKVTCPSAADGRGQDDTSAGAHQQGTTVIMAPVAAHFEALQTLFQTTPAGWTSITGNISAVSYNGNGSYSLTTSSDNSSVISPGMRLRTTRTVAAPTQCASLNGSNNYFSKSSPAGMTFTDDFVVSAWIKLTSYGAISSIATRYNGTSGWQFQIETNGTLTLIARNASSANYSYVQTYQSVPLNKWVHVTAQLDMSAFTASSTTSYVMINGVDVPAFVARGGTNPTALVQAGNLEIGSTNGGGSYFPGKIAQVAVYSAKVTQATIRGYISQGLSGSETSLISAYSFNNSLTDLNVSSANNLTNNNSTSITNADSPFGGQAGGSISSTLDYAIVQTVSASTLVVQVPEGCTIPTSGGVSACSYSSVDSPYGFPKQKGKWFVDLIHRVQTTQSSPTADTWYNIASVKINAPIGSWVASYRVSAFGTFGSASTSNYIVQYTTLSTTNNSETDTLTTLKGDSNDATEYSGVYTMQSYDLNLAGATDYYLNLKTNVSSSASIGIAAANSPTVIRLENAYL